MQGFEGLLSDGDLSAGRVRLLADSGVVVGHGGGVAVLEGAEAGADDFAGGGGELVDGAGLLGGEADGSLQDGGHGVGFRVVW